MSQQQNIIKVQFIHPINGQSEYYFGSLAAIFDKFTPEQIGASLVTLWGCKIGHNSPKITRNCIISKHILLRKSK